MKRLMEKTVFSGLVMAWRLATWPTSRSPALGEGHHRRRSASALLIGNHGGLPAFHNGDHGIGGAQIDTDNLTHKLVILLLGRKWQMMTEPTGLTKHDSSMDD